MQKYKLQVVSIKSKLPHKNFYVYKTKVLSCLLLNSQTSPDLKIFHLTKYRSTPPFNEIDIVFLQYSLASPPASSCLRNTISTFVSLRRPWECLIIFLAHELSTIVTHALCLKSLRRQHSFTLRGTMKDPQIKGHLQVSLQAK